MASCIMRGTDVPITWWTATATRWALRLGRVAASWLSRTNQSRHAISLTVRSGRTSSQLSMENRHTARLQWRRGGDV